MVAKSVNETFSMHRNVCRNVCRITFIETFVCIETYFHVAQQQVDIRGMLGRQITLNFPERPERGPWHFQRYLHTFSRCEMKQVSFDDHLAGVEQHQKRKGTHVNQLLLRHSRVSSTLHKNEINATDRH